MNWCSVPALRACRWIFMVQTKLERLARPVSAPPARYRTAARASQVLKDTNPQNWSLVAIGDTTQRMLRGVVADGTAALAGGWS